MHSLLIMMHRSTPEQIYQKLCSDLAFTTTSLKRYPKVYVIWNHRRWCLEHIPDGPDTETDGWKKSTWSQEMMIVEKMLAVDGRNCKSTVKYMYLHLDHNLSMKVHAWDYRRYILAHCPPSQKRTDADEITYTTRHIEKNHSNFSSWHQRSLVYTKLWAENPESKKGVLDKGRSFECSISHSIAGSSTHPIVINTDPATEFELVKQALWMVPDDQSGWIYHRWLIGAGEDPKVLEREIEMIEELQQEEPESRWVLNSLVHYKQLLLRHRPDSQPQIIKECKEMLEKLISIDPTRKNRYKDIGTSLIICTSLSAHDSSAGTL